MSTSIGKPVSRLDGKAKVTGTAKYSGDWKIPQLTYAVAIQSTIACGHIRSFDLRQAARVPGVIDILTFMNAPKLKKVKNLGGPGMGESFLPLQGEKVFYNGQYIGVVVAETLEAAEHAAKLVRVRYVEEKAKTDFLALQDEAYNYEKSPFFGPMTFEHGSFDSGMKKASTTIKQTYTMPTENHNPMEPSATVAYFKDGELHVYDATQGVSAAAKILGDIFKMSGEKTRVITKFVGGGFGCKGAMWAHPLLAVMAAKKTKRPVKLVLRRDQMFTGVGSRARNIQNVVLGADSDGKLQALQHDTVNITAVNKDFPENCGALARTLYHCDNFKIITRLIKANYQVPTFMRAPGESSGSFSLESAMDELAHELKIDPVKIRLINYAEMDPESGLPFSSKSLRQCYEQGAEKFGWTHRKSEPGKNRQGDYYIGHGMASSAYPVNHFPSQASVELKADQGIARVLAGSQDIGTGTYTVMAQIAADALGFSLEQVSFDLGDSYYPPGGVSGGSSTVSSMGWAITNAANDVLGKLTKLGMKDKQSPVYKSKADDITFLGGRICLKADPKMGESVFALMKRNKTASLKGEGKLPGETEAQRKTSSHAFGAQFAEVRVHALTGEIEVTRMVGAFASGTIINPKMAVSQYEGGMIFGIGAGLMEKTVADPRTGRVMTKDLADYHVPVNRDVPDLEIILVPEKDPVTNPMGSKGIGEIGIVGTAAAIANAVFNATGVRLRDLPMTPDCLAGKLLT
jgi:xanthine dehydrogenase YagR molybdenum-binding subunit